MSTDNPNIKGDSFWTTQQVFIGTDGPTRATRTPQNHTGPYYLNNAVYCFGHSEVSTINNLETFIRCMKSPGFPPQVEGREPNQPNLLWGLPFGEGQSSHGNNFVIMDQSNEIALSQIEAIAVGMWVYLDGTTFHVTCYEFELDAASQRITYATFDTITDTWDVTETLSNVTPPRLYYPKCYVSVRSDGDAIVLYEGDLEVIMGTDYVRTEAGRREAGSWTIGISVPGIEKIAESNSPIGLVRGDAANDRMHMPYNRYSGASPVELSVFLNDNTFGTQGTQIRATGWAANPKETSGMISFDRGGTIKIRFGAFVNPMRLFGWDDEDIPSPSLVNSDVYGDQLGFFNVPPYTAMTYDDVKGSIMIFGLDGSFAPTSNNALLIGDVDSDNFPYPSVEIRTDQENIPTNAIRAIIFEGFSMTMMEVNGNRYVGILGYRSAPNRAWYNDWALSSSLIPKFAPMKHIVVR